MDDQGTNREGGGSVTRLGLFNAALVRAESLCNPIYTTVTRQLNYLIDLEEGRRNDRDRLNDIILGVLAVREIEPEDEELASLLNRIVGEVEVMKNTNPTT